MDILLTDIPTDMKFGDVKTWTSDRTAEYIQKFRNGKLHIENEVYAVSTPEYKLEGKGITEERHGKDAEIKFFGEMTIRLEMGEGNVCCYLTTDGTNPTDPTAQRDKVIEAYALAITKDTIVSAFYQLFDEGIYEDQNYRVDVRHAIIICTSNYKSKDEVKEKLGNPIFNRFDGVIRFEELSSNAKKKIAEKELNELDKENALPVDIRQIIINSSVSLENAREIRRLIKDTKSLLEIRNICQ